MNTQKNRKDFEEKTKSTDSYPIFLPDATFGVVRSLNAQDLEDVKVPGVVMSTYHLMQNPGSSTIRSLGGLHKMYNWKGMIATNSGGFQIYSQIKENPNKGSISDKGIIIKSEGAKKRLNLTPEKTIQLQISYGSDILFCLDECTHPDSPIEEQELSVDRTIEWAKRGKKEYEKLVQDKGISNPPKLFGIIQGGKSKELRSKCTNSLIEIGFDGFGYGGWPIDESGGIIDEIFSYIRELVPVEFPLHALGIGHPENLVAATRIGWDIFDSALPTRDARRGRLYSFQEKSSFESISNVTKSWFKYLYIADKKHIKSNSPIFHQCDCPSCKNYSLGFLHHLHKLNDHLYYRLSTIHNVRYMTKLCEYLTSTSTK